MQSRYFTIPDFLGEFEQCSDGMIKRMCFLWYVVFFRDILVRYELAVCLSVSLSIHLVFWWIADGAINIGTKSSIGR